jgi:hypothetical protein
VTGGNRVLGKVRYLLLLVAGLSGLFQLYVVARGYAIPLLGVTWAMREDPAWERAAVLQEGQVFAGYIAFLRSHIPKEARVILPPTRPQRPLAHIGFMQYYLFPRDIHNCGYDEVDDCILRVVGRNTFILGLPDFPPRELAELSKQFVPYQDDYGVFIPK